MRSSETRVSAQEPAPELGPGTALIGPEEVPRDGAQRRLAERLDAGGESQEEDLFLDIGREDEEVEKLRDAGAGESERARHLRLGLELARGDPSLQQVFKCNLPRN